MLPESTLDEIVAYVDVVDARHAEAVCCNLRFVILQALRRRKTLQSYDQATLVDAGVIIWALPRCTSLGALDLRGITQIDDAVLRAVARAAPPLQRLNLEGCDRISDDGVAIAVAALRNSLELLDLTFARSTTYGAVLSSRQIVAEASSGQRHSDLLVRRLPYGWPGCFETPWGEFHTYWPDGSFDFGRLRPGDASLGWVVDFSPCEDGVGFTDRLQFVDRIPGFDDQLDQLMSADAIIRSRPGVLVRALGRPPGRNYAVVQTRDEATPAPPPKFTTCINEITDLMQLGAMVHFDDPDVGPVVISVMQQTQLPASEVAPPAHLLHSLDAFAKKHPIALHSHASLQSLVEAN